MQEKQTQGSWFTSVFTLFTVFTCDLKGALRRNINQKIAD